MNQPNQSNIAFLFDLDGVLVDTAKYHYQAWKSLANSLDVRFSEEQNEQLKGVSRVESLERILSWGGLQMSQAQKAPLLTKKNEEYLGYIAQMKPGEMLPGAKSFLERAKGKGVATALGSASKNARLIIEKLEIQLLLDAVVDGNDVEKSKPDPEVFLKGAEALKIAPARCVVFEDAEAGIDAARAAGMKCVGIGGQNLRSADLVVKNLGSITIETACQLI